MRSRIVCRASFAALMLASTATPALAELELPRPSPSAKVSQTVGLTDITVEYSSPAVKGRKIWGGLVPYDELWRTGANAATKVTFSKDVVFGGQPVPAGSYALFTIPAAKGSWTVILNKNTNQGGTREYKKELDLVRVQARPQAIPNRERLAFLVDDFTDSTASLDLEWEKLRVSIPIQLATETQALANIQAAVDGAWRPYNAGARYQLETRKDYDAGLALVEKSIAIKEDWQNLWTKASLYAAKGRYKEAYPLAERAQDLGQKSTGFFFAEDEIKKALADWKKKI